MTVTKKTIISNTAESLEEERDALRKELIGTQEMLAFVLKTIGEPVVVTKETLDNGLPPNTQIAVDDDIAKNAFVFSLITVDE